MENAHLLNSRTPTIASRLELKEILLECSTGKRILDVFPSDKAAVFGTAENKPEVHFNRDALSHKISWLRALVGLYESQLSLFSTGSGLTFGRLEGGRVALFIETTEQLCSDEVRFASYKEAVGLLTREQLSGKEAVFLFQFGAIVLPSNPGCLGFAADLESCFKLASEWTSSLTSLGQDCNLLGAMKVAAELAAVDSVCIVVATRPDQSAETVSDYMVNELAGKDSPKLHLVTFRDADSSTYAVLRAVAEATGSSYHGSLVKENPEGGSSSHHCEDTEMTKLRGELEKARGILHQLEDLQLGVLSNTVLDSLRDLSMEGPWNVDVSLDGCSPHSILCTSREWLAKYGLDAQKLSLYQVLGPNAYSQSEGFVQLLQKKVTSRVYDASMPLFKWHDQTSKYLHVDVHLLEQYKHKLGKFKQEVEGRLSWLRSGSRVPFGALSEDNVVVVLVGSPPTGTSHHTFTHLLQLFFEQQLSTRQSFNMIRVGRWYDVWKKGLVTPSLDNLKEAWRWATEDLGWHSNRGLLPSLRHIMEDWVINGHSYGIYLILFHPPTDAMDTVGSYLEQKMTGNVVGVTVIYYDIIEGRGGECMFPVLRQLVSAGGNGRFHHFKGVVCHGDDIDDIIAELDRVKLFSKTVDQVLANYCHHCKPALEWTSCLPLSRPHTAAAPQATITSSAREAAARLSRSDPHLTFPPLCKAKKALRRDTFYLDRGLEKGVAVDLVSLSAGRNKTMAVIPDNEEPMTSKEWLASYGIEAIGLSWEKMSVEDRSPVAFRYTDPQGTHQLLTAAPQQLKSLCQKLKRVIRRYQKRLQWLHAGSNRVFGSIIEEKAVFLLDISTSMTPHFSALKGCVENLLREKPGQLKSFNIIAFATVAHLWRDRCVPTSDESCTAVVRWMETLKGGGEACLLEALWAALRMEPAGIYLVSSGATTSTTDFLLGQMPFLRQQFGHSWRLNAVSFCCQEGLGHTFLKALAHSSDGRYHTWLPNEMQNDIKEWINLRTTEHVSDDVQELVKEVQLARSQLRKVKGWLPPTGAHPSSCHSS